MSEVIRTVTPLKIKYNDVFHFRNMYVMMHEYLVDEAWFGEDGPQDIPTNHHRDIEKFYMERNYQKGG